MSVRKGRLNKAYAPDEQKWKISINREGEG